MQSIPPSTHWRHFSGSFDLTSGLPSHIHCRCIIHNHFIHLLYGLLVCLHQSTCIIGYHRHFKSLHSFHRIISSHVHIVIVYIYIIHLIIMWVIIIIIIIIISTNVSDSDHIQLSLVAYRSTLARVFIVLAIISSVIFRSKKLKEKCKVWLRNILYFQFILDLHIRVRNTELHAVVIDTRNGVFTHQVCFMWIG